MPENPFENCEEVMVDEKRKIVLQPKPYTDYRLSYHARERDRDVHGVYVGMKRKQHIFLDLTPNGRVETYTCGIGKCFVGYYSMGDGGPRVPAVRVKFKGEFLRGAEKDFISKRIRQIRAR